MHAVVLFLLVLARSRSPEQIVQLATTAIPVVARYRTFGLFIRFSGGYFELAPVELRSQLLRAGPRGAYDRGAWFCARGTEARRRRVHLAGRRRNGGSLRAVLRHRAFVSRSKIRRLAAPGHAAANGGVTVHDGTMVDRPTLLAARRLLAREEQPMPSDAPSSRAADAHNAPSDMPTERENRETKLP